MPLPDHFRPPFSKRASWEGFHAQWPGVIVRQLRERLPRGYRAEPRVRLGTAIEIDIGAIENDAAGNESFGVDDPNGGGVAMAAATLPSTLVEAPMPEQYE